MNRSEDVISEAMNKSDDAIGLTALTNKGEVSSFFNTISPYMYTIVGFLGIMGNLFVAVIFATSIQLKKRVENVLLFHQSIIDSITGLLLILSFATNIGHVAYTGLLGNFICKYWISATPLWTTLQASICNLVIITLERYVEIVHPVFHKNYHNRRLLYISIALTWVFASGTSMMFVVFKHGVRNGLCQNRIDLPSVAMMKFNSVFNLVVKYLLPLAIFIYCYLRMITRLYRSAFRLSLNTVRTYALCQ